MNTAIKVNSLSKQYRLGQVGTGTLRHDLNRIWHRVRGKEDPYLKVGQTNDRTKKLSSEFVWALKDISFEVKEGEVLGIVGRNGAGKSTLLKILSKITAPTTGEICVNGRIASLLEVGTGFHPELTGRENIYLNGAILGMRKWEINSKFDEIVDFAGTEAYIDTPVKRYSSGMKVRLGFAVAAFLEPEILIVDEVLAVGDAEFQKKCIGRMKEVSNNDGRTVLFVSHNMSAVKNLCGRSILLNNGGIENIGETNDIVSSYLQMGKIDAAFKDLTIIPRHGGTRNILFKKFEIRNSNGQLTNNLNSGEAIQLSIELAVKRPTNTKVDVGFRILTGDDETVTAVFTSYFDQELVSDSKLLNATFIVPRLPLANGKYFFKGEVWENLEISDSPDFFIGEINVVGGDFYESGRMFHAASPMLLDGIWK